jgi:Ca2+-binding EF-hand superfamily protein
MISATSNSLSQIARDLFSKLDTSNKGYIQQSDLASAFSSMNSSSDSMDVSALFNQLDSDSDGKVTQDEMSSGLESLLGQLNNQYNDMRVQNGMPPPPPPPENDDEGYTLDELTSIAQNTDDERLSSLMSALADNFDAADTNGDGKINAEEAHAYQDQQQAANNDTVAASDSEQNGLQYILQQLIEAYGINASSSSTISYSA